MHDVGRDVAGHDLAEQAVLGAHALHRGTSRGEAGARRGKPRGACACTSVMTHATAAPDGAVMPREPRLGRRRRARAAVRRPLAAAGPALRAAGARRRHGRGDRPGRVRGRARALVGAARPDKALAYLRQAVVNRSRSALRHRGVVGRHRHAPRGRCPTPPGADEAALAADRRDAVLDAMRELPDRQREVLALRYYLDLSEAEIADALGISRGAVKSHASRGSAALRAAADYLEDRS